MGIESLLLYITISLVNVFLHIVRSILVIKASKLVASIVNAVCYTFSAIVIKFIADADLWTAIFVQMGTNFFGCYLAMLFCEMLLEKQKERKSKDSPSFSFKALSMYGKNKLYCSHRRQEAWI